MRLLLCAAAATLALGLAGCDAGEDAAPPQAPTIGAAPETLGDPETPATAALPNSGIPEPLTDGEFLRLAKLSDQLELDSSRLALEESETPGIRAFAQAMITEHTRLGQQLQQVAGAANIPEATGADPLNSAAIMARLRAAEGAAFDEAYKLAQIEAHEWAIELFEEARGEDGMNDALQQAAEQALPRLREHLEDARSLVAAAEVGPNAP